MTRLMKVFLALALGATLLPLGAGSALAMGVNCTFSPSTATVNVTIAGTRSVLIARNGTAIYADGGACLGFSSPTSFVAATVTNTDRIHVVGDASSQLIYLRLDAGRFAPGKTNEAGTSDEIEFALDLGQGQDDVTIYHASEQRDVIRFGTSSGTPVANLNANESTGIDADITTTGVDRFGADVTGGDDIVKGTGGKGTGSVLLLPMTVYGSYGNDLIVGGSGADQLMDSSVEPGSGTDDTDVVRGGGGEDFLSTTDWDDLDTIDGGTGLDKCNHDSGDTATAC